MDIRQPRPILGGLIPQAHFTTILILLINAGLFAATELLAKSYGGEMNALGALGAKWGPLIIQDHQCWRLVTAGFLHYGIFHIAMNSYALYSLGALTEQFYGTARFLVIYFVSTAGGFYLSLLFNPMVPSVGASAGITGLIGAMLALSIAYRSQLGTQMRNQFLVWIGYIVVIGLIPGIGVDNAAHIGGLAAGFGLGWIAGIPVRSTPAREGMWRVLAAVCVLATASCFLLVYLHFPTADQLR